MSAPRAGSAVVVGASIAGLTAARALADHVGHVSVIERRHRPPPGESIAAQGSMVHLLLAAGAEGLETLLPGFRDDLRHHGAVDGHLWRARWWNEGYRVPIDSTATVHLASRGLVETLVRERAEAIPTVTIRYGERVRGLGTDGSTVVGVETDDGAVPADLVVDCSGRTSKGPQWLRDAGFDGPPADDVGVDLWYTQSTLADHPGLSPDIDFYAAQPKVEAPRGGIAERIEGGRWIVTLSGYFGDRPPGDHPGFLAFADSLTAPDIGALLRQADALDEGHSYGFRSSHRWHYEAAPSPSGFIALGDSMCSVNPLYGQGMSVAVLEARALDELLGRRGLSPDLPRLAARAFSRVIDTAWELAATSDLAYPATRGRRTPLIRLRNAYATRVLRASTIDPGVADVLFDVQNLLAPASRLLAPPVVARTLRAQSPWRRRQAAVPEKLAFGRAEW